MDGLERSARDTCRHILDASMKLESSGDAFGGPKDAIADFLAIMGAISASDDRQHRRDSPQLWRAMLRLSDRADEALYEITEFLELAHSASRYGTRDFAGDHADREYVQAREADGSERAQGR